jgi:hypothetical protein
VKRALSIVTALGLVMLPTLAAACPVCGTTTEGQRVAFIVTTGILTFLPLMLMGAGIWWIRKRVLEAEEDQPEL